jgi:Fe-Mn family superoxide dismutase
MNSEVGRRRFVEGAALGAAVSAAALRPEASGAPGGSAATPAKACQLKPMSFDATKVKGMSEKLLVSHYQNNYSAGRAAVGGHHAQLANLDFRHGARISDQRPDT